MISINKNAKVKENIENTLSTAEELDVPLWSVLENLSSVLYTKKDYIDAGIVAQASITAKANSILCEKARQVSKSQHEISY